MNPIGISFEIAWSILLLYWIVSSFFTKRVVERRTLSEALRHWPLLIIAAFLLWGVLAFYPFTLQVIPQSYAMAIIGLIFTYLGLALALYARATLGRNWSGRVTFKEQHELVTKGPYAYMRHPIYTALLLMFIGTALAIGQLDGLLAVIVLFISFSIKLKQEEDLMLKHFPNEYPGYKARVKALVPFIY